MNGTFPTQLDPSLWKKTKLTHLVLFILGSLLMLPSVLVAYFCLLLMGPAGSSGFGGSSMVDPIHAAIAGTGCGVLAWSALGLLFFKRTDPRFHLASWSTVILFSVVAGYGTFVWLTLGEGDMHWITWTLWAVVFSSVTGFIAGFRNLLLAWKSLERFHLEKNAFLATRKNATQSGA